MVKRILYALNLCQGDRCSSISLHTAHTFACVQVTAEWFCEDVGGDQFADDSECALGGIRSAQQGQFSIESRDENTPYIKKIRVVNTIEYSLK